MRIDVVDPDTAGRAELDAWHEFCQATDRFDLPDDPAPPRAVTVGDLYADEDRRLTWFARSDDGLVGGATLMLSGFENRHFAEFYARVRPDARRSGTGRALLDRARATAVADGRTRMAIWARAGSPGAAFAAAMGAEPGLDEVRRVLRTDEVDRDTVAGWASGTASRVDGFDLVGWIDHCPEEMVDAYARAKCGMNDAPLGRIDWLPVSVSPERVRLREDASVRRGWHRYTMAVRERSTGALAGITEVLVSPDTPRAEQGETTVLEHYRGRRFGLWLKAAMLRWLSEAEPHVIEYETYNAAQNTHMIAVNERLGFRVVDTRQAWQLALA